jgi:hypothetical protein
MLIGIDYLSSVKIVKGIAVYTGGTNYVKGILKAIKQKSHDFSVKAFVLVPKEFEPKDSKDLELFYWQASQDLYFSMFLFYFYI